MLKPLPPALRVLGVLLFGVLPAQAQDSAAGEQGDESAKGWHADLSLFEEYRLRTAQGTLPVAGPLGEAPASNQTTDHLLRMLADGQVSGAGEHFRGLLSAGLWWDLDGAPPPGTPSLFATQFDQRNPWFALYAASAEWRQAKALDHVRVGRQASEHGLPLTFDGASIGLLPAGPKLLLFGFGGRTVHFFETDPGLLENWVASAGVAYRPTEQLRFELDSRLIQQSVLSADAVSRDRITNHSYGLTAASKSETIYSKLFVRGLDDRLAHAGGALMLNAPSLGLGVDGRIHAQLVTLGEVVESENPYFSLLGRSLPHVRVRLESWKEFQLGNDTSLSLHLGWRARQLINRDEQPFNRNTGAVYFQTRVDDLGRKGLFVSGTAEWNYVPRSFGREWLLALGGSAGYTGNAVKTEVGTYYQQFKILYYQRAEELLNTRTVFGSVAYRVLPWLELRGRYEFEILDRYLQTFYLSLRQDF